MNYLAHEILKKRLRWQKVPCAKYTILTNYGAYESHASTHHIITKRFFYRHSSVNQNREVSKFMRKLVAENSKRCTKTSRDAAGKRST